MFIEPIADRPGTLAHVSLNAPLSFTKLASDFVHHVFSGTSTLKPILTCVAVFVTGRTCGWGQRRSDQLVA